MIRSNDAIDRFVVDAERFPRSIPARVRAVLDDGIRSTGGGFFFASTYRELDLPVPALERFVNTIRLDTLRPVQRITAGSDAWVYECVAIGIAIGTAVLDLEPAVTVVVRIDLDDVEHPDATFGFGATVDDAPSLDLTQGIFTMRA